jgi:hypothetical protein
MTDSLTPQMLARHRRVPRFVFSLTSRLNGTWSEVTAFMRDHVLDLHETLRVVRSERLSLARFGDGELLLGLCAEAGIGFQDGSPQLQADLRSILHGDEWDDLPLLRCIPGLSASYYHPYWAKFWPLVKPMLDPAYTYGDTSVSREALFQLDGEAGRQAWRAIWDGQDVCYVVGRGSRFQPIDALFDCVASSQTVYSVPTNAYADLPRLVEEIAATVPRHKLILLALGPAATILAARLTRLGYWALDIGHISQAYQTVVHGAPRAETTPFVTPG